MADRDRRPDDMEPYWLSANQQPPPARGDRTDAILAFVRLRRREIIALTLLVLLVGVVIPRSVQAYKARQFKADVAAAIHALDTVTSVLEVGVLYADYARRVADTKAAVDQVLRKWPTDPTPPLRSTIAAVMDDFGLALESWAQRLNKEYPWVSIDHELGRRLSSVPGVQANKYGIHLNTARQAVWLHAFQNLNRARAMLGQPARSTSTLIGTAGKSASEQELDQIGEDAAHDRADRLAEIRKELLALDSQRLAAESASIEARKRARNTVEEIKAILRVTGHCTEEYKGRAQALEAKVTDFIETQPGYDEAPKLLLRMASLWGNCVPRNMRRMYYYLISKYPASPEAAEVRVRLAEIERLR